MPESSGAEVTRRLPALAVPLTCLNGGEFFQFCQCATGSPVMSLYQATITQRDSHDGNGLVRGALEVVEADRVLCKNSMSFKSGEGRRHYPLHDAMPKGIAPAPREDQAVKLPPRSPNLNAYASHCTSLEHSGMTVTSRRRESFLLCAFWGLSGPGGSYRHSGLSV